MSLEAVDLLDLAAIGQTDVRDAEMVVGVVVVGADLSYDVCQAQGMEVGENWDVPQYCWIWLMLVRREEEELEELEGAARAEPANASTVIGKNMSE